jgi:homoserine O-acetyltransferase
VDIALGTIKSESILIGIDSDQLFPVCEQKHIASCIPGAVYHEISSEFGHDGFLLENDQLIAIIEPLLP